MSLKGTFSEMIIYSHEHISIMDQLCLYSLGFIHYNSPHELHILLHSTHFSHQLLHTPRYNIQLTVTHSLLTSLHAIHCPTHASTPSLLPSLPPSTFTSSTSEAETN